MVMVSRLFVHLLSLINISKGPLVYSVKLIHRISLKLRDSCQIHIKSIRAY